MKKILSLLFAMLLMLSLYPITALSAYTHTPYTIDADGTYDLSAYGDTSKITINSLNSTDGLTVTLTNTTNTLYYSIIIQCIDEGTDLTIDGLKINNNPSIPMEGVSQIEPDISGEFVIAFDGLGNTLTIEGSSFIQGGSNEPAVRVLNDTELTILGSGSLTAYGASNSPGIGGNYYYPNCGTINILSGTINAFGGNSAAGVGGANNGSGGNITIEGGTVNATGGLKGAGIGGGENVSGAVSGDSINASVGSGGAGGNITIEGGTVNAVGGIYAAGIGGGFIAIGGNIKIIGGNVTATGGEFGAGIGGGYASDGGVITISGGTVKAQGGNLAAGIGGGGENSGYSGNGGNINIIDGYVEAYGGTYGAGIGGGDGAQSGNIVIYGGDVFCKSNYNQEDDLGNDGTGSLHIYGDSAVFLYYGDSITPVTSHEYFSLEPVSGGSLYGVSMPAGWDQAGGYLNLDTISFNINGATGSAPSPITGQRGTTVSMPAQGGITNGALVLLNWNTLSNGAGVGYAPGSIHMLSGDKTLYAIWGDTDVISVSISETELSLKQGDTALLNATVSPSGATKSAVSWTTSDPTVAGVSVNGLVTAIGEGTCVITAEADGKTAACDVTVGLKPVSTVSLSFGSKTMYVGDWLALTALVLPDDASNPAVIWDSTDFFVAAVNQSGVVTAKGAGSCTISATADGVSDTCAITVKEAAPVEVDSVSLTLETSFVASVYVGDTLDLVAYVNPPDATEQTVTWKSSDSSVASVNSFGKVMAISPGSAVITAEAQGKSDTYNITVSAKSEASPTPQPEPTPEVIVKEVVTVVEIDVSDLPPGTKFIKLPSGEIIEIGDNETIQVEVAEGDEPEFVALDGEQVALGPVEYAESIKTVEVPAEIPLWKFFFWGAIGLIGGTGGTLLVLRLLMKKRRV